LPPDADTFGGLVIYLVGGAKWKKNLTLILIRVGVFCWVVLSAVKKITNPFISNGSKTKDGKSLGLSVASGADAGGRKHQQRKRLLKHGR